MLRSSCLSLALLAAAGSGQAPQQPLLSSSFGYPGRDATYDYVVIGGGVAGLVVATRLAENASVAVIEAGGFYEVENSNNSVVPLLALTGVAFIDPSEDFSPQPLMDWGLVSEPIPGANGRRTHYAQAKTLGGSSAINTMSYLRGTKSSYERLANITGDEGWRFDNLLEYFKKSCELTPPNAAKRNNTNATVIYDPSAFAPSGTGGPLQVSWNNWVDPTITWLAKAVEEIGLSISSKGFSSGDEITGHGAWVPSTIEPKKAHRSSAESSYLRYALERGENLAVYTHTQAIKILFDNSTSPKAVGATVSTQGLEYTISAAKEVIVSAGSFHSPQLLMVSGIGPKETLDSFSIPVVVDLPSVGQDLQDPISFSVAYPVSTPSGQTLTANPALVQGYIGQYLDDGSGPFTSVAGFLAADRIPEPLRQNFTQETQAKLAQYPDDWPEAILIVGSFVGPNLTTIGATAAWLPVAFSRGNVTIRSASMADPPVINLNWLSDPADAELSVAAIKRLRTLWETTAAGSIKTGAELFPGADVQTDEQILAYIRANAGQIWHPGGTCGMGREGEASAVVDSQGRVFGVRGLRVVDASVLPLTIPTHPQGTIYALAEKIASDIQRTA